MSKKKNKGSLQLLCRIESTWIHEQFEISMGIMQLASSEADFTAQLLGYYFAAMDSGNTYLKDLAAKAYHTAEWTGKAGNTQEAIK